jgi:hypothetical protein
LTPRELSEYAERERIAITKFFTEFGREFPKLKMGCEDITNPTLMVKTALARIQNKHTSTEFISNIRRLKKYREIIVNLK